MERRLELGYPSPTFEKDPYAWREDALDWYQNFEWPYMIWDEPVEDNATVSSTKTYYPKLPRFSFKAPTQGRSRQARGKYRNPLSAVNWRI
jgi:hypothetical protein